MIFKEPLEKLKEDAKLYSRINNFCDKLEALRARESHVREEIFKTIIELRQLSGLKGIKANILDEILKQERLRWRQNLADMIYWLFDYDFRFDWKNAKFSNEEKKILVAEALEDLKDIVGASNKSILKYLEKLNAVLTMIFINHRDDTDNRESVRELCKFIDQKKEAVSDAAHD